MRVIVFGGTGFVGSRLVGLLKEKGHECIVRDLRRDDDWQKQLKEADAVINLAGEPLFKRRWNESVKSAIHASRVEGTKKIVAAIGAARKLNPEKAKILINASAIGYYPSSAEQIFDESSETGTDFLAFVCRDWEEAVWPAKNLHGARTSVIRLGVVLGKNGGALEQIVPPFKMMAGGPIGNGKQWFSWIHLDDVCGIITHALENENVEGVLNATSPESSRYKEFAKTLGAVLGKPSWAPLPKLALFAMVGEAASVLTASQRVLPKRTLESGYQFKFPSLMNALKDIFSS
jgi:hypothetical protein